MNRRDAIKRAGLLGMFGVFLAPKVEEKFENNTWYCGLCKEKMDSAVNHHKVLFSNMGNAIATIPANHKCKKCGASLFIRTDKNG